MVGRVLSLVGLIGGLFACVFTLEHTSGLSWTSMSMSSLFLGVALRGLWSFFELYKRNARLAVPLAYLTAFVYVLSGAAGIGALLAESMVPAIFLAPAAFGMAIFMVAVARSLQSERHAA